MGPLERVLYKPSVSVRGFYWRAGIEMFKDNFITGVGIDRYGTVFKQFRDPQYSLNYGFEISSSNAHSIPIQLFATGGVFVGVFFVLLNIYVLYRGFVSLKKFTGDNRIFAAGIFASWLCYQAQSLISIENIGLGIWGWILGGAVIGISCLSSADDLATKEAKLNRVKNNLSLLQVLISTTLSLVSLILISAMYNGEKNTIDSRSYFNAAQTIQSQQFYLNTEKVFSNNFNDPYYKLVVSEILNQTDKSDQAYRELLRLYKADPINLDYLRALAILSERKQDYVQAIEFRKLIERYDPWNSENLLNLGLSYKSLGNSTEVKLILDKILAISPDHPIATTAVLRLKL